MDNTDRLRIHNIKNKKKNEAQQDLVQSLWDTLDEPLASCMIVHFSAQISKWELVCKFGMIFHIFIISCLCSLFHAWNQWFFYSIITFSCTKYFVHSYTVDVVFTLSYFIIVVKFRSADMYLDSTRPVQWNIQLSLILRRAGERHWRDLERPLST